MPQKRQLIGAIASTVPLPQHLPAEEAMELLAVVHAEGALGVDLAGPADDQPRAEGDPHRLAAEQVQTVPLPGHFGIVLGQPTDGLLEVGEDGGEQSRRISGSSGTGCRASSDVAMRPTASGARSSRVRTFSPTPMSNRCPPATSTRSGRIPQSLRPFTSMSLGHRIPITRIVQPE